MVAAWLGPPRCALRSERREGRAGGGGGEVVRPDVRSVGARREHQVGPVVEYEERAVLGADPCEPSRRAEQLVVTRVLDPQLDDVYAAGERCSQEGVRLGAAH